MYSFLSISFILDLSRREVGDCGQSIIFPWAFLQVWSLDSVLDVVWLHTSPSLAAKTRSVLLFYMENAEYFDLGLLKLISFLSAAE